MEALSDELLSKPRILAPFSLFIDFCLSDYFPQRADILRAGFLLYSDGVFIHKRVLKAQKLRYLCCLFHSNDYDEYEEENIFINFQYSNFIKHAKTGLYKNTPGYTYISLGGIRIYTKIETCNIIEEVYNKYKENSIEAQV
eukprot:snap_masked-scaffold_19-processed-gene-5.34-mRNA-1 protein AED:1.00 eAED:1.00 QI:0/0/0/0/1/1/2/0/140